MSNSRFQFSHFSKISVTFTVYLFMLFYIKCRKFSAFRQVLQIIDMVFLDILHETGKCFSSINHDGERCVGPSGIVWYFWMVKTRRNSRSDLSSFLMPSISAVFYLKIWTLSQYFRKMTNKRGEIKCI